MYPVRKSFGTGLLYLTYLPCLVLALLGFGLGCGGLSLFGSLLTTSSMAILEDIILGTFLVIVSVTVGGSIVSRLIHVVSFLVFPVHRLLGSNNAFGLVGITLDRRNGLAELLGGSRVLNVTNKWCHIL
jgi:hypothetical protein